ncbi:MAG: SpoIIE family protein phosphatase [Pseudomonadota bacterium]
MDLSSTLRLSSNLEELERVGTWIADISARAGLSDSLSFRLDLCLVEAVTNVIEYGFDNSESHEITVHFEAENSRVRLMVEDDGKPFNPLDVPEHEQPGSLEEAQIGGLGIYLFRTYADECHYRRQAGKNRVTMILEKEAPSGPKATDTSSHPGCISLDPRRIKLLEHLPDDQVESVLSHCSTRSLSDGEILLFPGKPNCHLYILLSGRLRVSLDSPNSPQSFPVGKGECVGEMSIIDGSPVSAYVVAEGPTEVIQVHEGDFWQAVAKAPGIARNLLHILAKRMRGQHEVARQALVRELRLEHLEKELGHARRIQSGMLPSLDPLLPEHPQLDIAASMEPAREVGGDYYDVFALDDHRVAVAIGDVSGKGMPAALFMVEALTLLRVELTTRSSVPLHHVVHRINLELGRDNEICMFTTLFLMVVDVVTGEVAFVNGGHNHPMFAASGSAFDFLAMPNGMLVGVFEEAPFETRHLQLSPGDQLLLYTDGITEAEDPQRALFSDERLKQTLNAMGEQSAKGMLSYLREEVKKFAGKADQSDDITMVAIRYLGNTGERNESDDAGA